MSDAPRVVIVGAGFPGLARAIVQELAQEENKLVNPTTSHARGREQRRGEGEITTSIKDQQ